jgi:hypothetical protein
MNEVNVPANTAQSLMLQRMVANLAPTYLPWPFGMPTSVAPGVVVIGASPGNSPDPSTPRRATDGPTTDGSAHPGFYYRDTKYYWTKIRALCTAVARCESPNASEKEALAQCGHFNLGTGMAGTATVGVVEPDIVTWLSGLMGSVLPVKVVVGVGLNGILKEPAINALWNQAPGALRVDWSSPQATTPFDGYRFRTWRARRADGGSVLVCLWPNHPSRNPFTGPIGDSWQASVQQFCGIVRERGRPLTHEELHK